MADHLTARVTSARATAPKRRRPIAVVMAAAVLSSVLATVVGTATPAAAAIDSTRCVVEPATSSGTQSGVTAVAVGEQVLLGTEVDLEAGAVYQDILANPDGSTYIASWVGIEPTGALVADLSTLSLTIGGTDHPLTPGTEPRPGEFVLDTSTPMARVYFPGDPGVLTDPAGGAAVSFVVPAGGQTLRLTYLATVPELDAGAVTSAASCQAAISYGEANAATDARHAAVAVLGLDVVVAKSADLPVLAPSTTVTYSIDVSVPGFDATGEVRNGTAFDTLVTDDLPAGLQYVAGSASHGGVESAGVLTWNLPEIAAGASETLTYQLSVPADAPIGATYTNQASALTTSQPGDVDGEAERTAEADSVTLTNGAETPAIEKSSDVSLAGEGQLVTYTVDLTWPAGSTWHDVTLTDLIPDGMTLASAGSFSCAPGPCPSMTPLTPHTDTGGSTRFGFFVDQVGELAALQTWEWTYTATMVGYSGGGAPIPLGTELDNLAEVRFNLIPRLGGVLPNPARLATFDGVVGDVAPVTFDRPVVAIDKTAPAGPAEPAPSGLTYSVTLSNSGGVDAVGVSFTDAGPASGGYPLGAIDPTSVTGATFSGGTFTVALVPAGESRTVTYAVIGTPTQPVSVQGTYLNTATVTGYEDPAGNDYASGLSDNASVSVQQPSVDVQKVRLSASPIAGTDGESITYRVTVTNVGDATAHNVSGEDVADFDGTLIPGTCAGGLSISGAGDLVLSELAPGATASCEYQIELDGDQPEGTLDNTVTVTWSNGFGQTGVWTSQTGVRPWTDSDDAVTTVVHPQLALQKGPEADTPGNFIPNGGTGTYTITVTNVGAVTALDVLLSDDLPAGLTLEAAPAVATTPDGVAHTVTGSPGDDGIEISIPALGPGQLVRIDLPVRHDGVEPADDQLVNTATVTADGVDALADAGVLQWMPAIDLPEADKTASPASAGIGEEVTWTVTGTVFQNTSDVYDLAFVDTLPRGLVLAGYGTVACDGPLCATSPSPTPLAPAVLPTGETRLGWFVGDVPADTGDTTYTFTFTATIASEYSGTGSPPAGTPVTDTLLLNRIQPWLTLTEDLDRYEDGTLPNLAATSLLSQFQRRGATSTGGARVLTPRVIADKAVTNLGDPLVWQTDEANGTGWMASAGEEITYELTFANIGSSTAYDVELRDTMGETVTGTTLLRDVVFGALPPGVTLIDGWSLGDPEVAFHVDELGPGASVTVTYTGVVAPSEELVPGFSGDNRDVALIRNALSVDSFSSALTGGLTFEDTFQTGAEVYVYTPSPYLTGSACVGSPTSPVGTTATFVAVARNGAPPYGELNGTLLTTGYPTDPTVGVGHDATLTVVLSANVRYQPGTALVSGSAAPDPAATIDEATSVQTLVFDLGDVPPSEARVVTFGVRTIGAGVQGGMRATLVMDDASGSPSRGTAVAGAGYAYEHAISRGCAPANPLRVTKYPDLSYLYEGKKLFEVGEDVRWFGTMGGDAAPFHDGEVADTMPAGIDYTPGSAVFTVSNMTGPSVVASVANGNLVEEVTPLPDGRTQLRWTSPAFAEFRSISYRIDSVVGEDAILGITLTNVIDLITSDGTTASCSLPTSSACDSGTIRIISSAEPTVTKTVDHVAGPWGDTFGYTIDVSFAPNVEYNDAFIGDRGGYPRVLDGIEPFGATTITCLSGCASDPEPVSLPVYRDSDVFARAWYLGDLASQLDERTYRITYQQTFVDTDEYLTEFGVDPTSEEHVNEAIVGFNEIDALNDAAYQPGGPGHTAASSLLFGVNSMVRALDEAAVNLVRPELGVEKHCQALGGRDDLATSTSFGGETTGSTPNFRCVLTATNTTDAALGTTIIDPALLDTLPTLSAVGSRPVTSQLISAASDEPLVNVNPVEVPGSPLSPPAATALEVSAFGLELAPGESFSVTVDLRLTAAPAFWSNAALLAERTTNLLAAESFADLAGNAYTGDATDTWDLVIEKPKLSVSQRAWTGDDYEAALADGRPTACMAYGRKTEPTDTRIAGSTVGLNVCTSLIHARGHDDSPGGEYARAYGDGAPDVVLGGEDRVTWAVDTALVNPLDFAAVSVTDEVPYGFEYVPGSARLAQWSEAGTAHVPLADPVISPSPPVTCSSKRNFAGSAGSGFIIAGGATHGQLPWTPLTWTFAQGGSGGANAFWTDALAYLHDGNRGAAGALDTATPFDRMVRVVFDVRPTPEFEQCLQTPERSNSFRSRAVATGAHSRGSVASTGMGWVVGVELARVAKTPDGAVTADGTTATYDIDVTITDPTRLGGLNMVTPTGSCAARGAIPASPTRTPWVGLGDLSRNGLGPVPVTFIGTSHGSELSTELVVTDTFVDDGRYVPGSATVEMLDPWGRPFAGHLASEDVELITVDGRQASRVTWTFDHYPSPINLGMSVAAFPCPTDQVIYVTHPSSMRISVPLDIPDGTPDGTTHPNTAEVTTNHITGGEVVRTDSDVDDALITVRNPLPPPPATKTAVPDQVAPGQTFEWIVEADFVAGSPWLDLGWVDDLPASMDFLDYGTPTCVVTGTADPCSGPPLAPTLLSPVANGDGSTTVGWFVGDVVGSGQARTLRLPLTVRFVGDEVAGDGLTNVVTGFSNEDDEVGTLTSPPDPADFTYVSDPIVGSASVVEPSLEITKVVTNGPGPFQGGDVVTYDVTVTNNGGATAYDVPVSDTPDPNLTSVVTTSPLVSKGWTALDPRVEWFVPTVPAGGSVTFQLSGIVDGGYVARGVRELTNTATVAGYTSRPESEEDGRAYPAEQAAATVELVARNLTVEKFAGADCLAPAQVFAPGDSVDWCVVVANTGDAPAYGVSLTDLLPPGWTYEAGSAEVDGAPAAPAESTAASGGQRLEWALGDMGPGTQHVITYSTIGAAGSTLVTNTAIASSTLEDGTPVANPPTGFRARGQAQAAALGAGLQVAKLPDHQRLECDPDAGCAITWQIVVVNADDLDLTGATLTDLLPAGLDVETSTGPAGWADPVVGETGSGPGSTTPITWAHAGTFGSGDVASFEITARVPGGGDERDYLNHVVAGADGVPDVENQALAEVYSTASLGDLVWHDLDADGRQDTGEPGLAGVTVELHDGGVDAAAAALGAGTRLATTVTDADGRYSFANLEPGDYRVQVLVPDGWSTSPQHVDDASADSDIDEAGTTEVIRLPSGTDDPTRDAGLHPIPDPEDPIDPPGTDPADTGIGGAGQGQGQGQGTLPLTGWDPRGLSLFAMAITVLGWLLLLLRRAGQRAHAWPRPGAGITAR